MKFLSPLWDETPKLPDERQEIRISISDKLAAARLSSALTWHLQDLLLDKPLLILCIGTDRSTGDSLGPLTGTMLLEMGLPKNTVLGTLDKPVHATNLKATLEEIDTNPVKPLVVALDACLGRKENIGIISIGRGPLSPGAGVKKELPSVGQLYLTGIVNVGGFMEYFVLQNTRLSLVHRMALVISDAIHRSWLRLKFD